jgi:hypothetical protein
MGLGTLMVQARASLSEGGDASYSGHPVCFLCCMSHARQQQKCWHIRPASPSPSLKITRSSPEKLKMGLSLLSGTAIACVACA